MEHTFIGTREPDLLVSSPSEKRDRHVVPMTQICHRQARESDAGTLEALGDCVPALITCRRRSAKLAFRRSGFSIISIPKLNTSRARARFVSNSLLGRQSTTIISVESSSFPVIPIQKNSADAVAQSRVFNLESILDVGGRAFTCNAVRRSQSRRSGVCFLNSFPIAIACLSVSDNRTRFDSGELMLEPKNVEEPELPFELPLPALFADLR